jgi:ATP-dependent Clp protease ATP-binding subunit ClpC
VSSLARHLEQLQRTVEAPAWVEDKSRALACMSDPEFWSSPQRFATLGHVEYVDRIEAGLKRSASLLERLTGKDRDGRKHCPRDLLQRLAQQLYLLDVACRDARAHTPCDAFLRVEALRGAGFDADASDTLAARLAEMYRQWAALRGMRSEALEQQQGENGYRMSMAVSGYGAYSILLPENGLHVLECPDGRGFVRHQVRVRVAPQPAEPCEPGGEARRLDALRVQARDALAAADVPRTIVRRYRENPAPLVRDAVRGWRTGRFDLVLGGHFDIVGTLAEHARPEPTRATEAESS